MIASNSSMLNMLEQVNKDVSTARNLPKSAKGYTANEKILLIESAEKTIVYQSKDGEITGSSDSQPFKTAAARNRTMIDKRCQRRKVMVQILYRSRPMYSRICRVWARCWRIAGSIGCAAREPSPHRPKGFHSRSGTGCKVTASGVCLRRIESELNRPGGI